MYDIILSDPPWSYKDKKTGGSMKSGSSAKYPVMTVEEICDIPIKSITEKDSVLFLWATVPLLPEAFQVMNAWGYTYKTMVTWVKLDRLGLGYWFMGGTEHLLFGIKGKVKAFRSVEKNYIECPVEKHSKKPEAFRQLIDRSTSKMPSQRKLEMFARDTVGNWDGIGYDIDNGKDIVTRINEMIYEKKN